ncbi:MAG: sensor histidine kinase, partial [Salinirussus sp.]
IWPWLGYFLTPGLAGRIPLYGVLGITTAGYLLSAGAVTLAVTRGGVFDAAPAAGTLGPETVLTELAQPVLVLDHNERLVRANRAAQKTFALDPETDIGETIESTIGFTLDDLRDDQAVELTLRAGTRQFETAVSPVEDRLGRQPGAAVVFTDVTRERVRSQRLQVLNRVLRHNLRNRMSRIIGRAELLEDGDGGADTAEAILSSADELVAVSERAREIERMMSRSVDAETNVGLADLAGSIVDEFRNRHPNATLSVDIDPGLSITVDPVVLSVVLEHLIENGLEHNDAPTPVVTVSARQGDDGVRITVVDNGPGIPEAEQAVVKDGVETALEHGSGLGLWAAKWGAMRLGAELAFDEGKPAGSAVSLHLPASERRTRESLAVATAD